MNNEVKGDECSQSVLGMKKINDYISWSVKINSVLMASGYFMINPVTLISRNYSLWLNSSCQILRAHFYVNFAKNNTKCRCYNILRY